MLRRRPSYKWRNRIGNGGGFESEWVALLNRKWWRVWIGITGAFGPEYAVTVAQECSGCSWTTGSGRARFGVLRLVQVR